MDSVKETPAEEEEESEEEETDEEEEEEEEEEDTGEAEGSNVPQEEQDSAVAIVEQDQIIKAEEEDISVHFAGGSSMPQEGHHDESHPSPVLSTRHLSRSPPASRHGSQSRSASPSSLVELTAGLSIQDSGIKDRVANEVAKQRARQQRKYHSKRGAQRIGGRQKGSKAKMDTRVKPDKSGVWD